MWKLSSATECSICSSGIVLGLFEIGGSVCLGPIFIIGLGPPWRVNLPANCIFLGMEDTGGGRGSDEENTDVLGSEIDSLVIFLSIFSLVSAISFLFFSGGLILYF